MTRPPSVQARKVRYHADCGRLLSHLTSASLLASTTGGDGGAGGGPAGGSQRARPVDTTSTSTRA